MAIVRVTDAQTFTALVDRAGRLQVTIDNLQSQIASGKRLLQPQDDPLGATDVVRHASSLAALAQYTSSSQFGNSVLGAQDQVLGDATNILVRAEQIATEQASDLNASGNASALEEVHGLLTALTQGANTELGGRRLFGGLALDAPPPFTAPDTPGYDAATAYTGSTQDFFVKIGATANERVRLSTQGDQVFGTALVALQSLETALRTGGNVAATLPALAQGRDAIIGERSSVGAREQQLQERTTQVSGLTIREQASLSKVQDADAVSVISQLTQAQQALEAVLAAGSRVTQTSLVDLLKI